MNLSEFMKEELVFLNIHVKDKKDLFKHIVESMAANKIIEEPIGFLDELLQRESKASTFIGRGIALPHTRTLYVDRPIIAFARLDTPISFSQNPKDTVQLVFLMGTPKSDPNTYLKILADLCTQLRSNEFRDELMKVMEQKQVLRLLSN
ncbi:MAG: PTS sugar transporter subunit IIA [Deferribacteres bacterium]|nr:PTS sugar transporter subunit IIA [candidate division KSB1 bacterium]MCB9500985.1 PTS sugar transporter subunit IIA [Deferribacteres bacterium]